VVAGSPPRLSGWARFRAWPRWAQVGAWILLTPLPLVLLAVGARRWLARAGAVFLVILVAVIWLSAARVVVSAWDIGLPMFWPPWAQTGAWIFLTALSAMLLAARPTHSLVRVVVVLVAVVSLAGAGAVNSPTVSTFITERSLRFWAGTGVGLATLGLLYGIVFVLPRRLVSTEGLTTEQLHKAQNDARSGLLTALGGAVALAGAFTGGYVGLKQLQINREGQITERFTRAIDQLGSKELDIRVGGIYALERIARDSQADHSPIMEALTAFLREHAHQNSPSAPFQEPELQGSAVNGEAATVTDQTGPPRPRADLEAALTVIGRRNRQHDKPGTALDLSGIYLPRASLQDANLQHAFLHHANLQGVILVDANLQRAFLVDANLQDAALDGANLQHAFLVDANLQGASLSVANLQDVVLGRANLEEASLVGANLQGASLDRANLQGAFLDDANLQGASLVDANLQGASLGGARANRGTKWPTGFDPARAGVIME
jgi:uncharacterized protein YjbI with pentapeptide repeats